MRSTIMRLHCGALTIAAMSLGGCAVPVRVADGDIASPSATGSRPSPAEVRSFFQRAATQKLSMRVSACLPEKQVWHVFEVAEQGVVLRQTPMLGEATCDLRYTDVVDINDFPPGTEDRPKLIRAVSWTD